MGKTPKKAAPEGDERSRYVRRLKNANASSSSTTTTTTSTSTSTSTSSTSSVKNDDITTNLTATRNVHPEYENSNRGKQQNAGGGHVHKSLKNAASNKNFKSKLRSPVVKPSLIRAPKITTTKSATSSEKEASKSSITSKVFKQKAIAMQPKPEETEGGEIESQSNDNIVEECSVNENIVVIKSKKIVTTELTTASEVDGDKIEGKEPEPENNSEEKENGEDSKKDIEDNSEISNSVNQNNEQQLQVVEDIVVPQFLENEDSKEENEEHEAKLNLTIEDSPLKINLKEELNSSAETETNEDDSQQISEPQKDNSQHHVEEEEEEGEEEKEDKEENDEQNKADTPDTESYSVDVVESTTSETSETSEFAQTESEKTSKEVPSQLQKEDVSFVSFDASIMLKDVQVRLNDCLKDNSQLFDVTNDERSISEPACKDSSFGRTLRNISGRHSINRMRHVTLRSRLSPNSSLFVNMSTVSLPDEDNRDHKILRHRTGLSNTLNNFNGGTPVERKRKLEPEVSSEAKKVKTESESSLFNTSLGILQGLRRPIQVSTPNVAAYKFKSEKLDISGIGNNDDKTAVQDQTGAPKKWCSIM